MRWRWNYDIVKYHFKTRCVGFCCQYLGIREPIIHMYQDNCVFVMCRCYLFYEIDKYDNHSPRCIAMTPICCVSPRPICCRSYVRNWCRSWQRDIKYRQPILATQTAHILASRCESPINRCRMGHGELMAWDMGMYLNTLRPRQDGRQFPDDIFKCIFLNENV